MTSYVINNGWQVTWSQCAADELLQLDRHGWMIEVAFRWQRPYTARIATPAGHPTLSLSLRFTLLVNDQERRASAPRNPDLRTEE
ncbi:hypothetical protein HD597_000683 [Nonomuraea thailandensis]|uniref:Uncharacterized protein n=1 Tax=Nonomuraea thailandensis TaxID=1188745 RepID=A0A9X2JYC5_9ACTN|nr:hypothetical protein [Nonomuraea thailandensis]MCP2353663.1 hypothetical protein [Nonomuraea thailandensis]